MRGAKRCDSDGENCPVRIGRRKEDVARSFPSSRKIKPPPSKEAKAESRNFIIVGRRGEIQSLLDFVTTPGHTPNSHIILNVSESDKAALPESSMSQNQIMPVAEGVGCGEGEEGDDDGGDLPPVVLDGHHEAVGEVEGPLPGVEGKVLQEPNSKRLLFLVHILSQLQLVNNMTWHAV